MHNPTLIPALLRDTSVNKGLIYRELRKALPCRIGIEFEMGANFRSGFQTKYNPKAKDEDIAKFYKVLNIRCDDAKVTLNQALSRQNRIRRELREAQQDVSRDEPADDPDRLIESRISIKDYSQLVGLYKFMQDLPEFCTLHEGGGIHIHIDMSMFPYRGKAKENEIHKWITHRLDEVGSLFPPYKGKYNRKEVGVNRKSTWVNMSGKHTLEFRILPLTFDYATLMSWIVGIVKFRNKLIHECSLRKDFKPKTIQAGDEVWIEVDSNEPLDGEALEGVANYLDDINPRLIHAENVANGTYALSTRNDNTNTYWYA